MGGALAGLAVILWTRVADVEAVRPPLPPIEISVALNLAAPAAPAALSTRRARPRRRPVVIRVAHANVPVPRPRPVIGDVQHFSEGPRIAVIIDDMGVDAARSARVVALGGPLTLSYLPYAKSLRTQVDAARAAGHELLLHVSMEPRVASANPGPNALRLGLTPTENLRRLRWALDRFDGYVGINNHMGSRFTSNVPAMRLVLGELKRRRLLFVDSMTSRRSVAGAIAPGIGLPAAERDVFLDHRDDPAAIRRRLADLEVIARRDGVAVAIGHPRDATIAALRHWIPKAGRRGFTLVPISRVVRREPLISVPAVPSLADGPA